MDVLHAPWRIQYILAKKDSDPETSLFTVIAQSDDDKGNHVIARQRYCYAVLNTYPYNPGHTLVVPYRQVADLVDVSDNELFDLMKLVQRCQLALGETLKPNGANIGINLGVDAGVGIKEHLHIHIVPRWKGDTNFMPVTGQTAILPEALTETAAKLREALNAQSA